MVKIFQLRSYCICIIIKSEHWKLRHVRVSEFYFGNLEKKKGKINNVFPDFYLRGLDMSIGKTEKLGLRKPQGQQPSHDSIVKISAREGSMD